MMKHGDSQQFASQPPAFPWFHLPPMTTDLSVPMALLRILTCTTWYTVSRLLFLVLLLGTGWLRTAPARAEDRADAEAQHLDFFERQVRPLLMEKCSGCHGPDEQSGDLRVDQRQSLLRGGETAAAVRPGDPEQSLLIAAVRHQGDLEMPPDQRLSEPEIQALEHWIELGAPWPASAEPLAEVSSASDHWAFQDIRSPPIPAVGQPQWLQTPVDAFVLARLEDQGLSPSPPAPRQTLIRRVSYALTGLPPTPQEVDRFVGDPDPRAYERLVERLLGSAHYGEHWARHWLDVARYSDTKGYVYAREERRWVHAWSYRDWVVQAFNEDLPYDRFVLLQLAADQVNDRRPGDLAAMGFLTLGRRFLGVQREIIDDRIDVVCRGTMGLTVSCARCHNHKYDPIPTADYYSLYGVFDSCHEQLVPLPGSSNDPAFDHELRKRQAALQEKLVAHRHSSSERVRKQVGEYLFAQSELHKYPADGFDQIFADSDLLPAFVRQWEAYLRREASGDDAIFAAWRAFAKIPASSFSQQAEQVTEHLQALPPQRLNPLVRRAFSRPPNSLREVCDRYGELFAEIQQQWLALANSDTEAAKPTVQGLPSPEAEALRGVLYGPTAPCEVPRTPISGADQFFSSSECTELWKLQGEVDRWILAADRPTPYALTLVDRARPAEPRVFVRGNPLQQGRDVPRQFLQLLSGEQRQPFQIGSGRYELAQAIIAPDNPLTARVLVNRV
ncbi:MAG: DUF1549 domain-containing protein, partial [Planctomycetales bacterium]|nr:DUF1549 domain-containing protein [Planctomycetales bacterium]